MNKVARGHHSTRIGLVKDSISVSMSGLTKGRNVNHLLRLTDAQLRTASGPPMRAGPFLQLPALPLLVIFESILPIFMLVLLGVALKRLPVFDVNLWPGLETLGYYVLFPSLLFLTLANADFAGLELGAIAASALIATFSMFALLFALRPFLQMRGTSDASFTSIFQTSSRWNGFVALAIAERLTGTASLALVALVMAVNIAPLNLTNVGILVWYGTGQRSFGSFVKRLITNPVILSCAAGLAVNVSSSGLYAPLEQAIDLMARSALGLGLVMVGAGLKLSDALRPRLDTLIATALKLVVLPVIMIGSGILLGLDGQVLVVIAICASVPTAMNGYLLARQMGGDAPLYAAVTTLQTAASFLTIPAVLSITGHIAGWSP